jgi:hypothetical protein
MGGSRRPFFFEGTPQYKPFFSSFKLIQTMRFEIELSAAEVAVLQRAVAFAESTELLTAESERALESLNFKLHVLKSHLDGRTLQISLIERQKHFTPLLATSYREDKSDFIEGV